MVPCVVPAAACAEGGRTSKACGVAQAVLADAVAACKGAAVPDAVGAGLLVDVGLLVDAGVLAGVQVEVVACADAVVVADV